jgi:uncharacterized protein YecT (DUF1311 family)
MAPVRRLSWLLLAAIVAVPAFAQDKAAASMAQGKGEGGKGEDCDGGTLQIIECMEAQRVYWDKKLTEAYKQALKDAEPGQGDFLRMAERAWITYRDANCEYYHQGQGSISRINSAWCMRNMTEQRYKELAESPYPN